MHKKESALNGLLQQRLLPLFYHDDAQTSISILQALYRAGIRLVEYVHRGPNALSNFAAMKLEAANNMPGLQLGIGTIKNPDQAQLYIDAEADFIVCPTTEPAVGKVTDDAGLLWIPGCMTPTEIGVAEASGARLVKIFPGNILTFRAQWQEERRKMKVGDTILQQVFIPPLRNFSQKIIFGVRICDITDTPDQKGFSYETLAGHVEKGISTFTIERTGDNCIFKL